MTTLVHTFELLLWPLAACVCIGLLHAYAGLHVLKRGVIFVDLALAQMAALGSVVGVAVNAATGAHEHAHIVASAALAAPPATNSGADELDSALQQTGLTQSAPPEAEADEDEHQSGFVGAWPIIFAVGGAVLLSFGRIAGERVPHEAIIGIVYVVAAATTVLILSKSPHAHEQMEEMLTGRILFVDRGIVASTAGLYAILALLHWVFRRPFMAISNGVMTAETSALAVRLWDCLFYAIFALMVTRSVMIGGVLVVFSFLIIPGACAALLAASFRVRLLLAWVAALIVSVVGLALSAIFDLPSGSTLVATFGAMLIIALVLSRVLPKARLSAAES